MAEAATKKFLDYAGLSHLVKKLYDRGFKGMGLSQENFTSELLAKLNSTATTEGLNEINTRLAALEKLIDSDKDGNINKFNEIVAFLDGIEDTQTLAPVLADVAANKSKLAGIEAGAQKNAVTSVASKTGDVTLTKTDVGLGNVDNTSDLNKPISTATQTALDGKVDKVTGKGLSTNDYTSNEKSKLAALPTNDELTELLDSKLNTADLVAITTAEIDAIVAA